MCLTVTVGFSIFWSINYLCCEIFYNIDFRTLPKVEKASNIINPEQIVECLT